MPARLIRPTVVFSPVTPHMLAGIRTEPPVSDPSPIGAMPAATATPVPELDPPGRWGSACHGLCGVPWSVLMPAPPYANCTVIVLPSSTMPARVSRSTTSQSAPGTLSARRRVPAVVGSPATSYRSLAT